MSVFRITATFRREKTPGKRDGRAGAERCGSGAASVPSDRAAPEPLLLCTSESPVPPSHPPIYLAKITKKVQELSAFPKIMRRELLFWSRDNAEESPAETARCGSVPAGPPAAPRRYRSPEPLVPLLRISAEPQPCRKAAGQKSLKVLPLPKKKFQRVPLAERGGNQAGRFHPNPLSQYKPTGV